MSNRSFADLQAMQRLPLEAKVCATQAMHYRLRKNGMLFLRLWFTLRKRRNEISAAEANAPDTIPILP